MIILSFNHAVSWYFKGTAESRASWTVRRTLHGQPERYFKWGLSEVTVLTVFEAASILRSLIALFWDPYFNPTTIDKAITETRSIVSRNFFLSRPSSSLAAFPPWAHLRWRPRPKYCRQYWVLYSVLSITKYDSILGKQSVVQTLYSFC